MVAIPLFFILVRYGARHIPEKLLHGTKVGSKRSWREIQRDIKPLSFLWQSARSGLQTRVGITLAVAGMVGFLASLASLIYTIYALVNIVTFPMLTNSTQVYICVAG